VGPSKIQDGSVRCKLDLTTNKKRKCVNFTNVLQAAFTLVDPKSVKNKLCHQHLFTLSGSAIVKAVLRTLMKFSLVFCFFLTGDAFSVARATASTLDLIRGKRAKVRKKRKKFKNQFHILTSVLTTCYSTAQMIKEKISNWTVKRWSVQWIYIEMSFNPVDSETDYIT